MYRCLKRGVCKIHYSAELTEMLFTEPYISQIKGGVESGGGGRREEEKGVMKGRV